MYLFAENPTRVVVSVDSKNEEEFKNIVEESSLDWMLIGNVVEEPTLKVEYNDRNILECDLVKAKDLWKNILKNMF